MKLFLCFSRGACATLFILLLMLVFSSCTEYRTTASYDHSKTSEKSSGGSSQLSSPVSSLNFEERFIIPLLGDDHAVGPWRKSDEVYADEFLTEKPPLRPAIVLYGALGFNPKGGKLKLPGGDYTTVFNYVELPLSVRYMSKSAGGSSWTAGLGPYFSYAAGGHFKSTMGGSTTKTKVFSGNSAYKRFDAGVTAGADYMFPVGLMVAIDYDLGLANLVSANGTSVKNRCLSLSIGYSTNKLFGLFKKK